jgi:hypothetical protein
LIPNTKERREYVQFTDGAYISLLKVTPWDSSDLWMIEDNDCSTQKSRKKNSDLHNHTLMKKWYIYSSRNINKREVIKMRNTCRYVTASLSNYITPDALSQTSSPKFVVAVTIRASLVRR